MTSEPAAGARVLVVRLSALGDVLFTLPAVHALKVARPDLEVDWVVEARAASLLDLFPGLRRRIVWRREELAGAGANPLRWPGALTQLARHVAALRETRYDCVLDFQGNLKSGVHTFLARGRRKIGFDRAASREGNGLFRGESVGVRAGAVHRIDLALELARALVPGIPEQAPRPPLRVPDPARAFADAALSEAGLDGEPFAILHPGTSAFGAFKRWRPERFAHVADLLAQRAGVRSLVTFGPGELELAQSVVAGSKRGGARLAPRTASLAELAALLERARLVIASDSAALHLAAFLGTPVVALFGPKDPLRYGPRFAPLRVVRVWLPCSPCTRRTCPDVLCMEELGAGPVFEAALELLGEAAA